jgi:GNAT superfamily N-acetyltransferase
VPTLPVTTRLARPSDAETMARSLHIGFDTYRAFAPPGWVLPAFPNELEFSREKLRSRHGWGLMAEIAGEPAGHVAMYPDERGDGAVYLWQLFVRPPWWGTGLGHGLHEAFVAEARDRGYREARLTTAAAHARARRFYARRGWRPEGPPHELWNFGMPLVHLRLRLDR